MQEIQKASSTMIKNGIRRLKYYNFDLFFKSGIRRLMKDLLMWKWYKINPFPHSRNHCPMGKSFIFCVTWQFTYIFLSHQFIKGNIRECNFSTWGNSRDQLFLSTSGCISSSRVAGGHEWKRNASRSAEEMLILKIAPCGRAILQ